MIAGMLVSYSICLLGSVASTGRYLLHVSESDLHLTYILNDTGSLSMPQELEKVKINTGMGMVIPAWRLIALLNCEILASMREESIEII